MKKPSSGAAPKLTAPQFTAVILSAVILMTVLMAVTPQKAMAQAGFSTDSLGNLVGDQIGVLKDTTGATVNAWGSGTTNALTGLCPLLKTAVQILAAAMVIVGLINLAKGARGWGHDGGTYIRKGLILFVVASGILFLPDLINLVGLGYLPARADVNGIWGCIWA
jgi:hypothetical protein